MKITITVNGKKYQRDAAEAKNLLHFLREDLGLTGAKEGCGAGECGACTIVMNGKTVNSCLILAVEADGAEIFTIEGEAKNGKLSKLQQSFKKNHAVQCGFCTPGMIMSARALLDKNSKPTVDEIKAAIEGNFCRCTGYKQIIEAIQDASGQLKKKEGLNRA